MRRDAVLRIAEGYYLAQILGFLRHHDLLQLFKAPADPRAIADAAGFDRELFHALIEFVALRTTLMTRRRDGRFRVAPAYRALYALEFQIDKFILAYGPTVAHLGLSLTEPELGRGLVDRQVEARAYGEIQSPPNPLVLEEAAQRGLRRMIDLGCGPATLLARLARQDSAFRGWGIDGDDAMLATARETLDHQGLSERVFLRKGDARRLDACLTAEMRDEADAVHCKGLTDELFRHGDTEAIRFLSELRRLLPGRLLINVDYYGKLGRLHPVAARYQHTVLHDLIQHLTAQGAPPATLAHWAQIYAAAGCALQHAYESESSGIEWFVHIVRLEGVT